MMIWRSPSIGGISTHAPRTGSDLLDFGSFFVADISTHAPRTGSDERPKTATKKEEISTHAPRTGSDKHRGMVGSLLQDFNPRSPHGERPDARTHGRRERPFQPTLPARGATSTRRSTPSHRTISTHAPRTGSDGGQGCPPGFTRHFNPRSPHGERLLPRDGKCRSPNFNPRSPHGERRRYFIYKNNRTGISTHAPRTGSDPPTALCRQCRHKHFNPRSPHGERRLEMALSWKTMQYFNPRSPHGERHHRVLRYAGTSAISTHAPRTGSDEPDGVTVYKTRISTHAPRTGSDLCTRAYKQTACDFNPRSPHGERHGQVFDECRGNIQFQPTLPARGATAYSNRPLSVSAYFNPRSPHGERLAVATYSGTTTSYFNPRSPHGERP